MREASSGFWAQHMFGEKGCRRWQWASQCMLLGRAAEKLETALWAMDGAGGTCF